MICIIIEHFSLINFADRKLTPFGIVKLYFKFKPTKQNLYAKFKKNNTESDDCYVIRIF